MTDLPDPKDAAPTPPPLAPPPPPPFTPTPDLGAALGTTGNQGRAVLGRLDPTGWRPTLIVGAVLLAVVFGTQFVNALVPNRATGPGPSIPQGSAVEIGAGVYLRAQAGWQAQMIQPGHLRLSKGIAVLDARFFGSFQGDASALISSYVEQILRPDSSQLATTPVQVVPVAAGSPGARATYVGSFTSVPQPIEGQLTAVLLQGRPILFDAWASQGQLDQALFDVGRMLETLEVRG